MNHTTYYQLSLWEQDDRIMREDFNDNNRKIDAALAEKPYVTGSYTGDGKNREDGGQFIELGFRPSMVIVGSNDFFANVTFKINQTLFDNPLYSDFTPFSDTGFAVCHRDDEGVSFINLNRNGTLYCYTAFR